MGLGADIGSFIRGGTEGVSAIQKIQSGNQALEMGKFELKKKIAEMQEYEDQQRWLDEKIPIAESKFMRNFADDSDTTNYLLGKAKPYMDANGMMSRRDAFNLLKDLNLDSAFIKDFSEKRLAYHRLQYANAVQGAYNAKKPEEKKGFMDLAEMHSKSIGAISGKLEKALTDLAPLEQLGLTAEDKGRVIGDRRWDGTKKGARDVLIWQNEEAKEEKAEEERRKEQAKPSDYELFVDASGKKYWQKKGGNIPEGATKYEKPSTEKPGVELSRKSTQITKELNEIYERNNIGRIDVFAMAALPTQEAQMEYLKNQTKSALQKLKGKDLERAKFLYGQMEKITDEMLGVEKILTTDIAAEYLRMANGDKDKARELARRDGYK